MKTATFETNLGTFKIQLETEKAPITTANFIKLVEEGFYDGTRFHRVITDFMIQGGDPKSKDESLMDEWGTGSPGYKIKDEFHPDLRNHIGTIAMANSGPNTGGSQFFINVGENTFLDYDQQPLSSKHPVFGHITEGMDIIEKISKVKTTGRPSDRPLEEVVIEKITIN
ncbi:MAG: peptidylprolyl isomerase [Candidatus Woesearchaeota archaeon]